MAQHNEVGQWGEQTAALHLMHQDYQILERNWRFRHLEIDIIAEYLGEIVFVEVKTRSGGDFREARAAVHYVYFAAGCQPCVRLLGHAHDARRPDAV